jgi:Fe-Mn family superoxide dismutase
MDAKGPFTLPPLPFDEGALDPVISARTMQLHYGKHHRAYIDKLNELAAGTRFADMPLEKVVIESAKDAGSQKVFNNAAQAWNHAFFWSALEPRGGKPSGDLATALDAAFGSLDAFSKKFAEAAVNQFGGGWAWLVMKDGKLSITSTSNAGTPITAGMTPLLAIDVWEHAYYLDYENRRPEFAEAVIGKRLNWEFASRQMQAAATRKAA